jgi:hypothetical protein
MPPLAQQILTHVAAQSDGAAVGAKELLHLGGRAAVDQALTRLERSGALKRLSRGLYFRPIVGRFGPRTPSPAQVVAALASKTGETTAAHGAVAANALGLHTQVPLRSIFLTSGRSRQVKSGGAIIELRHGRDWELLLPGSPAGDAVRALAWAGKNRAGELVARLDARLPPAERETLLGLRPRLPTWLAEAVSSLAHG